MTIKEKVDYEDLILYEILRNPVLCGEFIQNYDKLDWEETFEFTQYQKEFLVDFSNYVSIVAGRAVGKTVSLSSMIVWLLIFRVFPEDYIVYSVPNKVHLDPVWTNLVRFFRSNSFLKYFVNPKGGFNSAEFKITLKNNTTLMCRIAGTSGTGQNVVGLHTPFFIVDESAYYGWQTFLELQPTINSFTTGFRLIVSGVPNGLREKNVCYHCDMENTQYSKHRVSAYDNPRFTEKDVIRAIEQYGGEDTDLFDQMVRGNHGKPVFAIFDRSLFEIDKYPVWKLELSGTELEKRTEEYKTRLVSIPPITESEYVFFGVDLGYTEPTAIVIMYIDKRDKIRFHGRIKMTKVDYPVQEELIDFLDSRYHPMYIGIDKGSSGFATVHHLMGDERYLHKNFDKKLEPIDFSSWTIIGIDADNQELKTKTKPFAVNILQEMSNNHKIIYSSTDLELITELERMTYTKSPSGEISYRTLTLRGGQRGEDHFTSALLCGTLAYHLRTDFMLYKQSKKKLFSPTFIY